MTISRRGFIGAGAAAAAAGSLLAACSSDNEASSSSTLPAASGGAPDLFGDGRRPNILFLSTDQQRTEQHWPAGKLAEVQPSMARLMASGLTFTNHFTSACSCSPSRGVIMSGTYPQVNGVLETGVGAPLQSYQLNLGRMLAEAGYRVAYKGKWHLSKPVTGGEWTEGDVTNLDVLYDLPEWNPPDAGTRFDVVETAGGGIPDNDGRFVNGVDPTAPGQTPGFGQSIVDFLEDAASGDQPFALFASLANPHDIGLSPKFIGEVGYQASEFGGSGVSLPDNFDDTLETKPSVQTAFRDLYRLAAGLENNEQSNSEYINLYAWLHSVVEPNVSAVLDALDSLGLTESTLIFRFSDHGEQGLSHGLVQKMYVFYEETINVPFVVSNPVLCPNAVETQALSSHVDLMPTVAALIGADPALLADNQASGKDLSTVLADPSASVQDEILFVFNELYHPIANGYSGPETLPTDDASQIAAIREASWKYAVYYALDGTAIEYEMYNLDDDPLEMTNLVFEPTVGDTEAERQRLHTKLTEKLTATGSIPLGFNWPSTSGPSRAAD